MNLVDYYKQQRAWREWPQILGALPDLRGQTVLDLGSGVGDQAEDLARRGARVIGVEMNDEVRAAAVARQIPNAEFRAGDVRQPLAAGEVVDGIWSSFTAAYFVEFEPVLCAWAEHLRPGGWIALTEIDDMFGHDPLSERTRACLRGYSADALAARRYDFDMGRKLRTWLERAGFRVEREFAVADRELAFAGAADPAVVESWRLRLDGMKLLRAFAGAAFDAVRDEFVACLKSADHRSTARVIVCLARR